MLDDLKADVTAALAGELRTATLWQYSLIDDGHGNELPGYDTPYACEGVRGSYDAQYAGQSGIPRTDAKIELLAGTLAATPKALDKVYIESSWWIVVDVAIDPASVMWVLQCSTTGAAP
ncbi:hypothetical protein EH240_36845 [Mesorhizobium tamadayense]|uniref:Uncharacterized protein n=1 Tax=Mesorhizobium tamadayense TaxID=425306 RepID=A0A3P3EM41_9HYPH|nr:hypothetical protein [Mesorhizobium tamadayense]RRH86448.1 hypothetical protein EH240_36845 [Mesorhizobium tamadayense]